MPRLALKVDIDTWRGTRDGVPNLLAALRRAGVRATFLFSLGPDHTGWALRRVLRKGFVAKVRRTSVVEHYGLRTLLYGTLLPGPDIGRRCAVTMRQVRDDGHETGIHAWDHVLWQDAVRRRDRDWTLHQMHQSHARFTEIFGAAPATHGAAGWQTNAHALRQMDAWGLRYASDGRATGDADGPHRLSVDGKILDCVQLPTTLPTLDELIGVDGCDAPGAVRELLSRTAGVARDHVFTLHAELEGGRLHQSFEDLLAGWQQQGFTLLSLADLYATLDVASLPLRAPAFGTIAGRSGEVFMGKPAPQDRL